MGAWKDWKIPASEISLGAAISCTKREIIYRYVRVKGEELSFQMVSCPMCVCTICA